MRILYLFILFLVPVTRLFSQSEESNEADELFLAGCYGAAYPIYLEQVKKYPENASLNYKLGVCLMHSRSLKARSLGYFKKAIGRTGNNSASDKTANAPIDAFKYLGEAFSLNYKFDSAIVAYEKYKAMLDPNKPGERLVLEETYQAIQKCRFSKDIKEQTLHGFFKQANVPNGAVTAAGEYSSSLSPDKL